MRLLGRRAKKVRRDHGRSGMRYEQLLAYVDANPSLSILEIGVARGRNALLMLEHARSRGGTPHYTGVDVFELMTEELRRAENTSAKKRPLSREQTLAELRKSVGAELADRIELHCGFSHDVLERFIEEGRRFDLIFIDAGHSFEAVSGDWERCQRLMGPDSTVVFDDYPNWGVGPTVSGIDPTRWRVRVLERADVVPREPTEDDPATRRSFQLVEVRPAMSPPAR